MLRSLQARILALALGLLVAVLAVTLTSVQRATARHARARVDNELAVGVAVFADKLATRQRSLWDAAEALAKDSALRQAIFTDEDHEESLFVALNNHRARTGADLAMLLDLDGRVRVDTRDPARRGRASGAAGLLRRAPRPPLEPQLMALEGRLYQVTAVPYYVPVSAPQPAFWLLLGRVVDDAQARALAELSGLEVSFVSGPAASPEVLASSLPGAARRLVAGSAARRRPYLVLLDESYRAAHRRLAEVGGRQLSAVLLRSSAAAFVDFRALSGEVLWIALISVLLATLGAVVIARDIARPMRALEAAARGVAGGDYSAELPVREHGEIGQLAREFERMQRGLREREAAIRHLAYHDDLTGLANRNRFHLEISEAIVAAARHRTRLAVAVVDLDRFKDVNDTLGHHVGDRLLLQLAERLQALCAERGLVLARLGGDEFGVLLATQAIHQAREDAAILRRVICTPFEADDVHIEVEASLGIALYPEHGGDPSSLLKRAEVAMYYAKERRTGIAFYDSTQDRHSVQRLSLMGELKRAIGGEGLFLRFQPKFELATGRATGAEALVRWQHPRLGLVSPGEFVPIAEQTGAIRGLTRWVLEQALREAATWQSGGLALGVAVNVSALDLHDAELPRRVQQALAGHRLPAERLVLEITESAVMDDPRTARRVLEEVASLGVTVSIDDFGTGYSSLAQLKRLPVQELKVDKSFVQEMERAPEVERIVHATVEMAHALGLRVVAEGVETPGALGRLREIGCDLVQGNLLGEPAAAGELQRLVLAPPLAMERG